MSLFKSYDEMDASHQAAYDLGRQSAEQRLQELEKREQELLDDNAACEGERSRLRLRLQELEGREQIMRDALGDCGRHRAILEILSTPKAALKKNAEEWREMVKRYPFLRHSRSSAANRRPL